MAGPKKRVALKPHTERIREWAEADKTDEWIADALGSTASSVQSFRSRNGIRRSPQGRGPRQRGSRGPESVFEGVLDHGERDGWGLWLDPSVAEDPIWREHWAGVESVTVTVAEGSIVLEAVRGGRDAVEGPPPGPAGEPAEEPQRERGRVRWFDAGKGFGFLARPGGGEVFFHHSEVREEWAPLRSGSAAEYALGEGERGPVALSVDVVVADEGPRAPGARP